MTRRDITSLEFVNALPRAFERDGAAVRATRKYRKGKVAVAVQPLTRQMADAWQDEEHPLHGQVRSFVLSNLRRRLSPGHFFGYNFRQREREWSAWRALRGGKRKRPKRGWVTPQDGAKPRRRA